MTSSEIRAERQSNILAFVLWAIMIGGFFFCLFSSVSAFAEYGKSI
jgi:uncharacterized membrane-anchored protein YjiN (DUF445 family)